MDSNQSLQNANTYLGQQEQGITFSSVLNSLFYLGIILIVGYYLWNWWQNIQRLKRGLTHQREGFTSADETDTLSYEIPEATQAKIKCSSTGINPSITMGIWDAAEDGYILFEENTREWTGTRLGQQRYSPGINEGLEELKQKYTGLIIETTKEMLLPLQQLGLDKYISVMEDLDKLVSANSQIAQLKGMSQAQIELLPQLIAMISEITDNPNNDELLETGLSTMTREELSRQIIRNRQMREYLETTQKLNQLPIRDILGTLADQQVGLELINIANRQSAAYKTLIPLLDEVISKRAKYENEKQEIIELLDLLQSGNLSNDSQQSSAQSANNSVGQDGGRGQIPDGVLGSSNNSPTSDRWPQRYYLNKRSSAVFKKTKTLDELQTQQKNPPAGLTIEEYNTKYNWIDKIGKDILPVQNDPEIEFALPAGIGRTIPDILTDFDHNNANCQRIYEECSTRANTPGFVLPNWDTADYYDYLDRLPNSHLAAQGETPKI